MSDGVLTKQALDQVTRDFRAWCDEQPRAVAAPEKGVESTPLPKSGNAALIKGVVTAVAPYIHELEQKLAALTARVAELEAAQGEMRYCGVWREGKEYSAGSFATDGGALWHANRTTAARPGSSGDWVMAAKSGQPIVHARSETPPAHARNGGAGGPANPRAPAR
jgi:hypothetical protein